jgi:hypothetical protein
MKATQLIEGLTSMAVEIFYINGEPDDPEISDLESTIELVAEAQSLPSEVLEKSRRAIAAEREATRREKDGEEVAPAPRENQEEKNEGSDIMAAIWELFDTAVRLDSQEKREQIFNSAQYIADFRGLEEQFIASHRSA